MEKKPYPKAVTQPSLIEALILLERIYRLIDKDIDYLAGTELGTTHDDSFVNAFNALQEEIVALSTERMIAELQNA